MKTSLIIAVSAIVFGFAGLTSAKTDNNNLPECCQKQEACCVAGAACCEGMEVQRSEKSDCCAEVKACCEKEAACCN